MTSTGTYSYLPATSNLVLQAYARIGIRRTEITAQHMEDAYNEANLTQVTLSNKIPNLFLDELFTQVLTAGTATYSLPVRMVAFQAPYISIESGGSTIDRIIYCYSTFEYSAIPNKEQQAPPTSYWVNLLAAPEITFWPVPDDGATYTFKCRLLRQVQDASLASGTTPDVPYRWLDCYVAMLAHRLARIYARDQEGIRKGDADEAWAIAATTDKEQTPSYLQPSTFPYWD